MSAIPQGNVRPGAVLSAFLKHPQIAELLSSSIDLYLGVLPSPSNKQTKFEIITSITMRLIKPIFLRGEHFKMQVQKIIVNHLTSIC